MKSKAYIIKNGRVIAEAMTSLKNGAEVIFAYATCREAINANRKYNLVNASTGKISRNKKWNSSNCYGATEIYPGEFYICGEN